MPNEKKMSCRERKGGSLRVKPRYSYAT